MYLCLMFAINPPHSLAFYMEICTMAGRDRVNFIFERAGGTDIFVLGCALRSTPVAPHRGDTPAPTLPTSRLGIYR